MEISKLSNGIRLRIHNEERDIVIDIPKRNLRLHTDTDFLVWNK